LFYSGITKGKVISFLGVEWDHPDTLYSYTLSFSFLVVAIMSPILSAIADYTGNKKKFLKIFCTIGALSVMSLYFFEGLDTVWIGIVFTFFASIGFWSSVVFYNSYLPEVAHPEDQDRVSAKGFIYGYIGSIILLVINLIMILFHEYFGITEAFASRVSFVMVGLWWIGFAQITFKALPNNSYEKKLYMERI
jgi:UMF1 family MFS transporter